MLVFVTKSRQSENYFFGKLKKKRTLKIRKNEKDEILITHLSENTSPCTYPRVHQGRLLLITEMSKASYSVQKSKARVFLC